MRSTYARVMALVGYHIVPHTVCHPIYSDINGQRVSKVVLAKEKGDHLDKPVPPTTIDMIFSGLDR